MKGSEAAPGHLALPEGAGPSSPRPGVVLIPDVWGLSDLYREFAERMAREGFVTLALDLHGEPVEITDPGRFLRELSDPEVLARVRSGLDFLASHPACAGRSLGVVGFCIGGTYALHAACSLDGVGATVAFYGILSHDHGLLHDPAGLDPARKPRSALEAVADLRCPTLGIFGTEDEYVPIDDVRELESRADHAGRPLEVRLYPGCGHAFLNETRPAAHRPEAARDAWERMLGFLSRKLNSPARR